MPVITRQIGVCFAAEVDGIDMTGPLSADEVAAIHAGMDKYAVLVFHDQAITDEQQLAFTRSLGEIEHAIGTSLRAPDEYRRPTTFADVSSAWCAFIRGPAASRSTCPRTRAPSSAGRYRRRGSSCATWLSTRPSGSSSTRTRGAWATSSCGTTVRRCTVPGPSRRTSRATCVEPRSPATGRPWLRPPPEQAFSLTVGYLPSERG